MLRNSEISNERFLVIQLFSNYQRFNTNRISDRLGSTLLPLYADLNITTPEICRSAYYGIQNATIRNRFQIDDSILCTTSSEDSPNGVSDACQVCLHSRDL